MSENTNDNKNTWLIIIALIALVGMIAKLMGKSEQEQQEEKAQQARDKLTKLVPPSFQDFQYMDWANSIYSALFSDFGEDEDAVYAVFKKLRNITDVNKLVEAFGHRRATFSMQDMSLPEMISYYFSSGEKETLNEILRKKSIPYYFG